LRFKQLSVVLLVIGLLAVSALAQRTDTNAPGLVGIREKVLQARMTLRTAHTDFQAAKDNLRTAAVNARVAVRTQLMAKARVMLSNQGQNLEEKTNELKARGLIVASTRLEELAALRRDANRGTDANKLAEVSRRLREKWRDIVADAYTDHAKQLNARFLATIEKTTRIVVRLEAASAKLAAAGKDTAALDTGIAKIKSDLNTLLVTHTELKVEFEAATTPEAKARVVYKAKHVLRVAHQRLQRDLRLLRQLVALQIRLNSGTPTEVSTATSDVTTAQTAVGTSASLDTQLADAEVQAQTEAAAVIQTDTTADTTGGDTQ
ncbi:MAG: hypothetical protein Q7R47_05465, partial [Candidatus Diapherotrites archaeon]|nr:hypothetical protein [Candidatus Diapherotrites archaeon]